MRVISKPVGEKRTFGIDYRGKMPEDATLTSGLVTAKRVSDAVDVTTSVLFPGTGVAAVSGTRLRVRLVAGQVGECYELKWVAFFSNGDELIDYVLMKVEKE